MDVEARRSLDAARQKAAAVQAAREDEEDEEEELLRHLHDDVEPMDASLSTPVAPRAPPPVTTAAEISAQQRERMEVRVSVCVWCRVLGAARRGKAAGRRCGRSC